MTTSDVPLIPAKGRILEGILKRREIRELAAEGLTKNQIGGRLNIGSTALNRHLRKIAEENAAVGLPPLFESQRKKQGAA